MKKIGIFCSASESIDKMYFDSARQIGEWIGQTGKTLIYGGASLGLMECVARAVKENAASIGYHQKKVIFYNEYGFYDELLKALGTLESKGFARKPFSTYYEVANTLEELKEKIY